MLLTSTALIILHLWIISKAIRFFRLPGSPRHSDKVIAASMIAASVLFILSRASTLLWQWPVTLVANSHVTHLWVAYGLFNAMLYLGVLHQLIAWRTDPTQRRQRPIERHYQPQGDFR